jgi:hypothetical protein
MVGTGGTSVTVVLSAVNDPMAAPAGSENQFSLMFDGPTKRPTFAVPVDRADSAQHYQMIIYSS